MGMDKIIIGIVLIAGSLYYIGMNMFGALNDLIIVVNGALPLIVLLLGLLMVWLQLDEMMTERKVSKRKK